MEQRNTLERLIAKESLTETETGSIISSIMKGELTPAQIAAFLTALRAKGETVEEIAGAAQAMRAHAATIPHQAIGAMDTCGTGGDHSGTFNISTTAAFVVAGAGVPIAKHGNRSATSQCGSFDLIERFGVNIMMTPEQIGRCLDETGMTVLFARVVHPAMKHAAPVRSELGVRTIFNFLGPLTNPALPEYQLIGISDAGFLKTYAMCLQKLNIKRAWVVSGSDGLDEITLTAETTVIDVTPDRLEIKTINPEDAGLKPCALADLKGGAPEENEAITRRILSGEDQGPKRDAVLMNAAACLVIAGRVNSLKEGVEAAAEVLSSGKAQTVLERLIEQSNKA